MWLRKSKRTREDDFDRELRNHLDLEAEERMAGGSSTADAQYDALRSFGNVTLIRERMREVWTLTSLEELLQDVRYALRGACKSPALTTVALVSLTLGIGAATAVFSVLNAVAFQPLPVPEASQLVILKPELRDKRFVVFNPQFEELRQKQRSLSGMFAVSDNTFFKAAFEGEAPVFLRASLVSGNYFEVLQINPALGRLLTSADDQPSGETCAAVISHQLWTTKFSNRPDVLGRKILVRDKACLIAGVAPPNFRSHESVHAADVWLPLRQLIDPKLLASGSMGFFSGVMGRLRDGVSIQQAQAELTSLYQGMQNVNAPSPQPGQAPTNPGDFRMRLIPGAQGLDNVPQAFGQPLLLALGVTGIVLLVASVNVANLLLARGTSRETELATRAALGAGRSRLMRLLAIEGLVLACCGGLLGFTLAWVFTPALARAVSLPDALEIRPDLRVLGVAAAATLLTALIAGVVPAFRLSRSQPQLRLAGAGRSTGQRSSQRLVRVLIAAQLALSLLLVTSAGLLLRSMLQIMSVDPGFESSHVVLMAVRDTTPAAQFGDTDSAETKAKRAALYRSLDERLSSLPGIRSAGISWLGLFGGNHVGLNLYDTEHPDKGQFTLVDYISPGYFDAVGMRLLRGRGFTAADREGALRVAVVNEAFVRERATGHEAIGRRLVMTYGDDLRPFTVVGVIADAKYNDLREKKADPMVWVPIAQVPVKLSSVSLRVEPGAEATAIAGAQAALKATSHDLMVRTVTTLRAQVAEGTARERLLLRLASGFGILAVVLAAIGLYGTLSYSVTRRTQEIGVRLALGAQRRSVMRLMMGESLTVVVGAILVGVPLSLGAGYLLRGFLFGVTASDATTLVCASVVLAVVALVATFGPAHRASRVDPMHALKYE